METREWPPTAVEPTVNGSGRKPGASIHPVALGVGLGSLVATPLGLVAWIWSADWRWAPTGLLVMLALVVLAAALNGVLNSRHRA